MFGQRQKCEIHAHRNHNFRHAHHHNCLVHLDNRCRGGHGNHDRRSSGGHDGGYGENDGFCEREFPTFDAHQTWVFSVLYLLALSATLAAVGFLL